MASTDRPNGNELGPELRAAYQAERSLPSPLSSDARTRILANVQNAPSHGPDTSPSDAAGFSEAASGAAPPKFTTSALAATSIASGVLGATLAIGVMLGAATNVATKAASDASRIADTTTDASVAAPTDVPDGAGPSLRDGASIRHTPKPATTRATEGTDRTFEERNLIDRARAALARRRPHDALVALMQHERLFAKGVLSEDREYLVIRAFVAQGKTDRATRRAASYMKRYPGGAYRQAVERLLAP